MSEENEPLDNTRDSVLYVIDGSIAMAESGALDMSLRAASDAIRATAKLGDSQYDAGVILYNVADAKNGMLVLLSLGEPRIDDLKQLMKIAADKSRREKSIKSGDASPGIVASALRVAKAEMNRLRVRSLRRIVLITDDDDPCHGQAREMEVAQTFSTDLTEMQVAIFPIFVQHDADDEFNVGQFWNKLSYVPHTVSSTGIRHDWRVSMRPVNLTQLGNSFNNLVFSKSRRKMASLRGSLRLEALHIGVKGYHVVHSKPRRPAGYHVVYVKEDDGRERRELVTNTRKVADKWSGKEVDTAEVSRAFSLSSKHEPDVPVSAQQLDELRHYTDASETVFDVYGFVPVDSLDLPLYGFVGHSTLLVPSNDRLQNSARAFSSLHRSMQRLRQAAIVTQTLPSGRRSPPSVGLIFAFDPAPVIYEKQRAPEPNTSVGLFFVPFPFADDVRQIPAHVVPQTADERFDELRGLVNTLVHKFRLESGFDPARFYNPRFAQFSSVLESLALSLEMETKDEEGRVPREPKDPTKPRYEKINRNVGHLSAQIRDVLDSIRESAGPAEAELKSGPASKRAKESHGDDLSIDIFKKALASNELGSFLVADLKWALRELTGKSPNVKKADLVQALKERLASEP